MAEYYRLARYPSGTTLLHPKSMITKDLSAKIKSRVLEGLFAALPLHTNAPSAKASVDYEIPALGWLSKCD